MNATRTHFTLRALAASALAATALVFTAPRADAQPAPAEPVPEPDASNEARGHFNRGVTFYDEGDYSAALVEFKRAYALVPTWQVLYNVGQSYFQVRDYARALVTLKQFVHEGQDRIPKDRHATADTEIADLANRVGHVKIDCNRAGAAVSVDGIGVGVTPLRDPLLVSVGVRKIATVIPGSEPLEQEVSVSTGETVELRSDFPEPATAPVSPPEPPSAARASDGPERTEAPPSPNRTPAWVAFGVAALGAGAGAVFGGLALHDKSRLDAECAGKACAFGSQADIDSMSRDGTLSTAAFGVAAAAVITGVTLWLTSGLTSGPTSGAPARSVPAGASWEAQPSAALRWTPGSVAGSF